MKSWIDQILDMVKEHLSDHGIVSQETSFLGKKASTSSFEESQFSPFKSSSHTHPSTDQTTDNDPSESIASKIDHTLLKPDATIQQIEQLCEEARDYHFASVCVNSSHIRLAAELLAGSEIKPIAVVGFPLGAASTACKAFEAKEAVRSGAREIDMVIQIGALKSRNFGFVLEDIYQVVQASRPYPVKVILETSLLNMDEKIIGCALAKAACAAFVKTSTGFSTGGATLDDIALMRRIVGPEMGVKASGGIRTYDESFQMIQAGATRLGTSASVSIIQEERKRKGITPPNSLSDSLTQAQQVNQSQAPGSSSNQSY